MTDSSSIATQAVALPEGGDAPVLTVLEIDQSCRVPVLVLFTAAALWLGIGALLGVLTAIKAHAPGFLAGFACLTYGRVRPAGANALVYGFLLQAGLGMALWMICRLGHAWLRGRTIITGATVFWNIGMLLGVLSILAGGSTGYEWLEMPRAASPILFCGYVLLGAWALINLHFRQERTFYVSQWFLLTSLLWFPWVYSSAQLLLVYFPVRGVMQSVVDGWYTHNLFELCLAPFGLAAIFYFLPKLTGRPLHSRGLALYGFWLLVLVGGWGGARAGEPVPNWISGVSVVARVFMLLPLVAFAMSWVRTFQAGRVSAKTDWVLKFIVVSACGYLLAAGLATLAAHPVLSRVTLFTLYDQGVTQLRLHGFLVMALAGAIYYIAPRVVGHDWPAPRLIPLHFWGATVGIALTVLALVIGGLVQGAGINQPQTEYLKVVRGTLPFLGMSTLGATLLLASYIVFIVHLVRLLMIDCPCSAVWNQIRPRPVAAPGKGKAQR